MTNEAIFEHVLAEIRGGTAERRGKEVFVPCPECGDPRHFSVRADASGVFHCFKCHCGGALQGAIQARMTEWRSAVVLQEGRPRPGVGLPGLLIPLVGSGCPPTAPGQGKASERGRSKAFAYCEDRGVTFRQMSEYQVCFRPFEPRVFFPYWDEAGDVVFWTARALGDFKPKTVEMDGSVKPLYGRHVHRLAGETCILVEGVFDHFVTPHSYAIMGAVVTGLQAETLAADGIRRAFLIGDPDAGEAMRSSRHVLARVGVFARPVVLGNLYDPADLGPAIMEEIADRLLAVSIFSASSTLRVEAGQQEVAGQASRRADRSGRY